MRELIWVNYRERQDQPRKRAGSLSGLRLLRFSGIVLKMIYSLRASGTLRIDGFSFGFSFGNPAALPDDEGPWLCVPPFQMVCLFQISKRTKPKNLTKLTKPIRRITP